MPSGTPLPKFPAFPKKLPLLCPENTSQEQEIEREFLKAVQGNILKGHGRDHLRLVFFRFPENRKFCENFLKASVGEGEIGVNRWVISAQNQLDQRENKYRAFKAQKSLEDKNHQFAEGEKLRLQQQVDLADTQLFSSIMLTRAGLAKLDVFLKNEAFNIGLIKRVGDSQKKDLSEPYASELTGCGPDGLFLLACDNEGALEHSIRQLSDWCSPYGVILLSESEKGTAWKDKSNPYKTDYEPPREPFGFVDGISQPHFFYDERLDQPMREGCPVAWEWTNLKLDYVFIGDADNADHQGGTFVTLLKIEQNVAEFRKHEANVAHLIYEKFRDQGLSKNTANYLAPALLMGRTRLGYPLGEVLGRLPPEEAALQAVLAADFKKPDPATPPQQINHSARLPSWLNEFDFENQTPEPDPNHPSAGDMPGARRCPFHVHIRKMNPRTAGSVQADKESMIAMQPVRRGAAYDPEGLLVKCEDAGDGSWPEKGVGLLFLAYMRDIVHQFERPYVHWSHDTEFPMSNSGVDPLVIDSGTCLRFGQITFPAMPRVLDRRGGFYLYVPSIPWLQRGGAKLH